MLVKFQIIHKLDKKSFISVIENAIKIVVVKITEEHPPYYENEELPVAYKTAYNKKCADLYLTGIILDFSKYTEAYYEDYDSTISMGYEWGAGSVIDEFITYLDLFIKTIKSNSNIVQIIKYEDANIKNAYWLLTKEIYELEMQLRELINFLLFVQSNNGNICSLLKNKIKIRHSIKNTFFDENLENEIFSLDFTHYQQIFETYPEIFTEAILNDIDKIRIFRNSVMHNKGYTYTYPKDFWESEKRLFIFIKEFWASCKNL